MNTTDSTRPTPAGRALVVGLTHIDKDAYGGWDGRNGCRGCRNDAATISEALFHEGFRVQTLIDEEATAEVILSTIREEARTTQPGETFFFFYAGHGGQKEDTGGDEADGQDETLICYNRPIIDDELRILWEEFAAGTVIYMIGDSCNSGTSARLLNTGEERVHTPVPVEYQTPYAMGARDADWPELKARLLHMGGCRDGFSSFGDADGGVFTKALIRAWRLGHGEQTWQALFDAATDTIYSQDPRLNTYGANAGELREARPFSPFTEPGTRGDTTPERYSWDDETRGIGVEFSRLEDDDEPGDLAALQRSGVLKPDPAADSPQARDGEPRGLPISESSARRATRWLMEYFGPELASAGEGTPFGPEVLCGIVCQETAYFWLPIWDTLKHRPEFSDTPEDLVDLVVARCVLDASGDYPGTSRSAFPRNASVFREHYGSAFTSMLIGEANETRALRGYSARNYLYKGYGIFQYDLQFVKEDEGFFRDREWHDFSNCLNRCMGELKTIHARTRDKWQTIYRYNGRGRAARQYCENVKVFSRWASEEIRDMENEADALSARGRAGGGPRTARGIKPSSSPQISKPELESLITKLGHDIDRETHPLLVVGIRGYYLDSMGAPGENERGLYDDAIFLLSEHGFASFNGNTDPSSYKKGSGFGNGKGRAVLNKGVWYSYKFDTHYGSSTYPAICQRLGPVTVTRDGHNGNYEDHGWHGINIHRGGYSGTSSLGCQTIYPTQWNSFYSLGKDLAQRYFGEEWDERVIPYVLIDEKDRREVEAAAMT